MTAYHNILKGDTNMDDIKLLTKGREHDVYSIHYSSNGKLFNTRAALFCSA